MTVLYHGTSLQRAEQILAEGRVGKRKPSFWGSHLTAGDYASAAAEWDGSEPVVFAVPAERFDDDFFVHDNGNIGVAIKRGESLDEACRRMFGADLETHEADRPFGFSMYTAPLPVSSDDLDDGLSSEAALEALKDRVPTP